MESIVEQNLEKLNLEVVNIKQQCEPNKNLDLSDSKLVKKAKNALIDLYTNHNCSWAMYMYERNKNHMDDIAIVYRGNKIPYKVLYSKSYEYACTLRQLGFQKGDEIALCISNIPEFAYMLFACSWVGVKANVVGEWFDKEYLKNILNTANSEFIFVSDDNYNSIFDVVENSNIKNVVVFSLTDSFKTTKDGIKFNPYETIDSKFHNITNRVNEYQKKSNKKIINESQFVEWGKQYRGSIVSKATLDDIFTITYTSGTTKVGCPKGVKHANRSYMILSRFKDSDVSGMPAMKNLTVLAHIPTYTHMELTCALSDTFYCNCTLAMEPFYQKEFFPYSLVINKPNFVPASVGFWVYLCKLLNFSPEWKNVNMPYLMIPTVTGEGCSVGEEKFLNLTSRKHKFGVEKLPFPLAPVTFSIGGGTGESSGIFVTLFKAFRDKSTINNYIRKETLGLTPHKFAEVEVLDENGEYCDIGKPGRLVVNSLCNMIGYTNENLNDSIKITDAYGKNWMSMETYSYKSDKAGRIKMKGRLNSNLLLNNGTKIPLYIIEDIIGSDTKNIMSCSIIKVNDDSYVCHIEMQPMAEKSVEYILNSCVHRLGSKMPQEVLEKLYLRVRSFEESFPIAPSGKRNTSLLKEEKIGENCIAVQELLNQNYQELNKQFTKKLK